MPRSCSKGVEIYYETHGERQARPLVLIMGLGAQLIHWPEPFIARLVANGHFVVTFDNRDVGLSTTFSAAGRVDLVAFFRALARGEPVAVPYGMSDMADDVLALMDALELRSAHLAGLSMGGRVAHHVAIARPERVRSLVSMMSTTGGPNLPPSRPEITARLLGPLPQTPEELLARGLDMHRAICVNPDDFDEERSREKLVLGGRRGHDPACNSRQMAAMFAAGSSEPALRALHIPALVIHGALDPLLPVEHGQRTHECLHGSTFWIDEHLGHYMPERVLLPMADAISELTARSDVR